MKAFLLVLFCIILQYPSSAQETLIFKTGLEGHAIYCFSAIISLPNGDLMTFAESRVNGNDDFGDVNLVMKKATTEDIPGLLYRLW